jgi:hypothetical protein
VCYIAHDADHAVCKNDQACADFPTRYPGDPDQAPGGNSNGNGTDDMVCYKGGLAIERNFQMCDVTSEFSASSAQSCRDRVISSPADRKIIDTIPDNRPPQVTFSCTNYGPSSNMTTSPYGWSHPLISPFQLDSEKPDDSADQMGECVFQFWVDRVESFYCELKECRWEGSNSAGKCNTHICHAKSYQLICSHK